MSYTPPPTDPPPGWQPPPTGPPPGWQPPPGVGGQPPQGYGPYSYGPPPGAYYGGEDHPQGTTVLVLGILGIVFCPILSAVAWVMGSAALKEIDAQPGRYRNRGNVQAGRILGIIYSVVLLAIMAMALIAVLATAIGRSS